MPDTINQLMEKASLALVKTQYAESEALACQALAECRQIRDWGRYARVLLPLQEARRQRRLHACDAGVFFERPLGDAIGDKIGDTIGDASQSQSNLECDAGGGVGGVVVEGVWIAKDVQQSEVAAFDQASRERGDAIEVLWVADSSGENWVIRSFAGIDLTVHVPALVLPQGEDKEEVAVAWYLQASEALGDAVVAQVDQPLGSVERVVALEKGLAAVLDHEKLHQALALAAREAARQRSE